MIDTHCHIDLYNNPLQVAKESERLGIITIGMTNLPSHFEMGFKHLIGFTKVRLALGMHPLYAESHYEEFPVFLRNIARTSYIGEIGLDFSKEGIETKDVQISTFKKILVEVSGKKKILSIHSRRAEKEVLQNLIDFNIQNAVFHWYSGPLGLIDKIIEAGYYFSINPAMIKSKSGMEIISRIPMHRILTESDGPFIEIKSKPIMPNDIKLVHEYLSLKTGVRIDEIESIIENNFKSILKCLK